jgi:hypothetical protein
MDESVSVKKKEGERESATATETNRKRMNAARSLLEQLNIQKYTYHHTDIENNM